MKSMKYTVNMFNQQPPLSILITLKIGWLFAANFHFNPLIFAVILQIFVKSIEQKYLLCCIILSRFPIKITIMQKEIGERKYKKNIG